MAAEADGPFGLSKFNFRKLIKSVKKKERSLPNWTLKTKKETGRLYVSYWSDAGPAEYKGEYAKGGYGMVGGIKSQVARKFENHTLYVDEVHYDEELDAWIIKADLGPDVEEFYRLSWANAYQNDNYPHYKSRDEVNKVIAKDRRVRVW